MGNYTAHESMHFHVHRKPVVVKEIFLFLALSACTIIVDLLRMLYVLGSKEAEVANIHRFTYFFDVADEHMKELAPQLARSAANLDRGDGEAIAKIERDCMWVLGQIKRRADINFNLQLCFSIMHRVSNETYDFLSKNILDDLQRAEEEVISVASIYTPSSVVGCVDNLIIRLAVQSQILARQTQNININTIAHDASRAYALYYFLIDRFLLSGGRK